MEEKALKLAQMKMWLYAIDEVADESKWQEKFDTNTFISIFNLLPSNYLYHGHMYYPRDELVVTYLKYCISTCINELLKITEYKPQRETIRNVKRTDYYYRVYGTTKEIFVRDYFISKGWI